jgi:ATP-binding cassette subfamily F protein uup
MERSTMLALKATGIEISFSDRQILQGLDLVIKRGERVGLVGPNGCGKSTLIKILAGKIEPDHGEVVIVGRFGLLGQEPDLPFDTVGEAARSAIAWHTQLLADYEAALDAEDYDKSADIGDQLDFHGWEVGHRIDAFLDKLQVPPPTARLGRLSGGEKRRLALAMALLGSPDILILDEPTNHLDTDSIEWLESYLTGFRGALLLITHDRYLLESVATRIVEIEQGVSVSYDGSYADYLISRAERRARMATADGKRRSIISREAEWASRSPAARSTKQKARLDRLDALKAMTDGAQDETFSLQLHTRVRQGATLAETRGLSKSLGGKLLFKNLDFDLFPGNRLGILGPNGCGKSTLLRIIAKQIEQDSGEIHIAKQTKIALFDQHRTGLKPDATVQEAAADGNDQVKVGDNWVHVAGFLRKFLFSRQQLEQRVSVLSGGERARLLLARLLLSGANLILFDEPTNDLDLLTLRVLEEALLNFNGAAVIVTHDRAFLDRVCTGLIAFAPDGTTHNYADRMQYMKARRDAEAENKRAAPKQKKNNAASKKTVTTLTYDEKKELKSLPALIEQLESEIAAFEVILADPDTYQNGSDKVVTLNKSVSSAQAKLDSAYTRWEELSERAEA